MLKTKPVKITIAVCIAAALLTAAFFLQPGKSEVPAALGETVPFSQQEQVELSSMNAEAILQQKLEQSADTQTVHTASETVLAQPAVSSAVVSSAPPLRNSQQGKKSIAPGAVAIGTTISPQVQTTRASASAVATTTRYAYTLPTNLSQAANSTKAATSQVLSPSTIASTHTASTQTIKTQLFCTVSIRCDTLLSNMDKMKPERASIVPAGGVILQSRAITFTQGESAFDVLRRVAQREGIHLEFANVPLYGSAYIEGIGNIYEFDCGQLSGWMYRVNGAFPNYGCGRYTLKQGDVVEWLFTCDLGKDIGGEGATGQRG